VLVADASEAPSLARLAADAAGQLRPGGRVVVRLQTRRGLFGGGRAPLALVLDLLRSTGVVAARHLADDEGVSYFEARKPRGE
jgi:hypothetical protein